MRTAVTLAGIHGTISDGEMLYLLLLAVVLLLGPLLQGIAVVVVALNHWSRVNEDGWLTVRVITWLSIIFAAAALGIAAFSGSYYRPGELAQLVIIWHCIAAVANTAMVLSYRAKWRRRREELRRSRTDDDPGWKDFH